MTIRLLEHTDICKKLVPSLFDMMGKLLRHGGPQAKRHFEECAGDEFLSTWEDSTNQYVRRAVKNFEDEFIEAEFNEGDILF